MNNPSQEDSIDPILEHLINNLDQLSQVQYSLRDQLGYLSRIAVKYGLYDAAEHIKHELTLPPII
jgi:hypothetical protein